MIAARLFLGVKDSPLPTLAKPSVRRTQYLEGAGALGRNTLRQATKAEDWREVNT